MHELFNKYASGNASGNASGIGAKGMGIYGSSEIVVDSNTKSRDVSPSKNEYAGSYNYSSSNNYNKYGSDEYAPAYTFESKK